MSLLTSPKDWHSSSSRLLALYSFLFVTWSCLLMGVLYYQVFAYLDELAAQSLKQRQHLFAHPRKGIRWVKDRYFKVRGSRRWVFTTVEKYADGKVREYTLLKESDTPIVRQSRSRLLPTRMTPIGMSISSSDGARKCSNQRRE